MTRQSEGDEYLFVIFDSFAIEKSVGRRKLSQVPLEGRGLKSYKNIKHSSQKQHNQNIITKKSGTRSFPCDSKQQNGQHYRYVSIQTLFQIGSKWEVMVTINNKSEKKTLISFSPEHKNLQYGKTGVIKYGCSFVQTGKWQHLIIDLKEFYEGAGSCCKNRLYQISINGQFRLSKICATNINITEKEMIPSQFLLKSIKNTHILSIPPAILTFHQVSQSIIIPKQKIRSTKLLKLPKIHNKSKENHRTINSCASSKIISRKKILSNSNDKVNFQAQSVIFKRNLPTTQTERIKKYSNKQNQQKGINNHFTAVNNENSHINPLKDEISKNLKFCSYFSNELCSSKFKKSFGNNSIREQIEYDETHHEEQQRNKKNIRISLNLSKVISQEQSTFADESCQNAIIKRNSYLGFGENIVQNYFKANQRPFSPPLEIESQSMPSHKNQQKKQFKEKLCLFYDPVLYCLYDSKLEKFYEIKR